MVEKIVVNNRTNKTVVLYSHDGDDIHIPGKAQKVEIDAKFDWNLPPSVVINKDKVVSTSDPIEARSNLEEAKKLAFARKQNKGNFVEKTTIAAATPEPVGDKPVSDDTPVETKTPVKLSANIAQGKAVIQPNR